ncbi:MAG: tetratricopeptide repeat protein [Bacteroidaceae bacterium]|nr:tetratricopeptide repeat protein [Bacteroidaceae bacterium]
MKKVLFTMAMLVAASGAFAQQSVIKEAKKLMKGSFGAAETTLAPALTNPETKDLAETWDVAGNIQKDWFDNEYKKKVLGQPADEAQMYTSAMKAIQYFFKCDELAQKPDAKGKINNKFRNANTKAILELRNSLIEGGIQFFNNYNQSDSAEDGKKAVEFLGAYAESAFNPMLESANLQQTDQNLGLAAFYASAAAQRMEDWASIAKYAKYAANDAEYGQSAAELAAEALKRQDKMDEYFQALKEGVQKYPQDKYFFANAVSYYTNQDKYDDAIAYVNEALASDPNNSYKMYVKGVVLAQAKKYDDAIATFQQATTVDPENAEAWSMLGDVYRLQAQDFSENATMDMDSPQYAKDQQTLREFYAKAREPYEKARQLKPDERNLWLNGLYTVYYNLHLQSEFNEIEALMNN